MATHEVAAAVALPGVAWHVSTRSGNGGGNCVEAGPVLDGSGRFAVRDSKDRAGGVLVYRDRDWAAFVVALRHGTLAPPA